MAGTVTIPSTTTTYHRVFAVKEATILTTTEGTPAATGVTIEERGRGLPVQVRPQDLSLQKMFSTGPILGFRDLSAQWTIEN